jgi:hypothetical protein
MAPPQVNPGAANQQFSCDMLLFDEESDRHVRIPWADAVKACLVERASQPDYDAGDGGVRDATTMDNAPAGKTTAGDWLDKAVLWAKFNAKDGTTYAECEADGGRDVRIVVARPFIECATASCLLAPRALRLTAATRLARAGTSCTMRSSRSRAATRAPRCATPF